jgi:hypothetical protein
MNVGALVNQLAHVVYTTARSSLQKLGSIQINQAQINGVTYSPKAKSKIKTNGQHNMFINEENVQELWDANNLNVLAIE